MTTMSSQTPARLPEATPGVTHQWITERRAVLVDVREPDEHAAERIAGAVPMPLSRFDPGALTSIIQPGQSVVLHCKGGKRSGDACRLCAGTLSGLTVYTMTGGIEAWKAEGLPVVTGGKGGRGISVLRQVQLVIGIGTLAGAALAYFVHPAFLGIPAFLGAGLTFAGATGTCGLASLLSLMPWNKATGTSCSMK